MTFEQILSTNSLRKYMEISLENLYVDTGTLRVKFGGFEDKVTHVNRKQTFSILGYWF